MILLKHQQRLRRKEPTYTLDTSLQMIINEQRNEFRALFVEVDECAKGLSYQFVRTVIEG